MSFVDQEIASQAACWRQAAELAGTRPVRAALPEPGARVALIGCGSSWFMAQACARLRERAGQGETDAFSALELPLERGYDHVVAITRSGTTTEVVRVLEALATRAAHGLRGAASARRTVITTGTELPVNRVVTGTVAMPFADERSVVQTRFATSTLALWRAWLHTLADGSGDGPEPGGGDFDIDALAAAAAAAAAEPVPDELLSARQLTYVAQGWAVGLAHEAALKAREAAQLWTESYPAAELRHGPISVLDPDSVVWMLGPPATGLVDDVAATGARVVSSLADPMVELVRAQRFAVAAAAHRGLDPDAPRNLTRAVILADAT